MMQRREILKTIIENQEYGDQALLLNALENKGIKTTQATISRDLQAMGYVKVRVKPGLYKYQKVEPEAEATLWDRLRVLFNSFVIDVKGTNNLVLIKTSPGNANGVASLIDNLNRDEILGTIAGDDTVLIVIDTVSNQRRFKYELNGLLS